MSRLFRWLTARLYVCAGCRALMRGGTPLCDGGEPPPDTHLTRAILDCPRYRARTD